MRFHRTRVPSKAREVLTHGSPGAARGAASGGEGTQQLSRRSMVAGLAAAFVPAVPALAAGGDVRGPDAELIGLGRRYLDLVTLETAADETYQRCCEASRWPEPPEALRHRLEDHLGGLRLPLIKSLHPGGLSADPSCNSFWVEAELKRLRYAPPPCDAAQLLEQRARIAEIELAHETWLEECRLADQVAGVDAALEAIDEIATTRQLLVRQIASRRATTLAGMRVRALVISDMVSEESDEPEDVLTISAMIRDLLSIEAA